MSFASIPCFAWWFVAGAFAGWLLWWLIDRLFLRNGKSAERLASLEADVQSAKAAHAQQLAEIDSHKSELANVQGQFKAAQAKLTEKTQQLADLETNYQAEYAKVVADRDGLKSQLAETSSRLNSEHESADAQLIAAHKEADSLKAQLKAALDEIGSVKTNATTEIAKLQQNLAATTDVVKATQSRLDMEHKGTANLQGRIPGLEAEIGKLKTELTAAMEANAAFAKLQNDWIAKDRAYQGMEGRLTELQTALTASQADDADAARASKQFTEQTASLRTELADAHANADRASKAAQTEIAELRTALAASKNAGQQMADLKAELAATRAEAERTTKELHVAQDWLTRTGTELEGAKSAQAASAGEIARLQAEIGTLNVQIGSYDKLRKALEAARQAADIGLDFGKKS